jgi:hypothetical protein
MNRSHVTRTRLSGMLLAVAAALAVLVLPGLATGDPGHHDPPADAGTIQSFDPTTGVLAIDLTNGGTVSGLVVQRTHIRCGDDRGRHRGHNLPPRKGEGTSSSHRGGPDGQDQDPSEGQGPRHGADDPPGHDGTAPGSSENPGKGAEHSDRCTTADLVPGTTVKVAELVLIDGNAFYKLVALPAKAPATT